MFIINKVQVNKKMLMRPEFRIHSKPSEYSNPVFTPKYEYVEVGQLIISPDSFENSEIILSKQLAPSASAAPSDSTSLITEPSNESKYRSNIQHAIEFSQYGNKQHTSRIIITEPMLENIMKIPIVVRRMVNEPLNSQSQSASTTYIPQSESYGFDGEEHYLTTYSKNTEHGLHDDEKYETHLPSIKPLKYKTTYEILKNTFLNKIMTRFTGANSIRRAYKHIDYSGKGVISKHDLKVSLNILGIYLITDDDFNLLYFELAGQPNKMITYIGFKNYIDKNM